MKYHAVDSFVINCLFVLALHQIGGGATESGILLTYLGLPSTQTFQKNHFGRIEKKIRPTTNTISESAINIALDEEMILTLENRNKGDGFFERNEASKKYI